MIGKYVVPFDRETLHLHSFTRAIILVSLTAQKCENDLTFYAFALGLAGKGVT
jgi:hypothetical protein